MLLLFVVLLLVPLHPLRCFFDRSHLVTTVDFDVSNECFFMVVSSALVDATIVLLVMSCSRIDLSWVAAVARLSR